MKLKLDCVFVVEGKTDTALLKQLFDVQTIETNGSELNKKTITLIEKISKKRQVILLLDPDHQGQKITSLILEKIPYLKICFLTKNDLKRNSKKSGIAEMDHQILQKKIINHIEKKELSIFKLNWLEYLELSLNTKNKRIWLCQKLDIPYFNHKQLFQKLNLLDFNFEDLKNILRDWKNET